MKRGVHQDDFLSPTGGGRGKLPRSFPGVYNGVAPRDAGDVAIPQFRLPRAHFSEVTEPDVVTKVWRETGI